MIRVATTDDAEAIRSIYNLEVETSKVTFDIVPRSLGFGSLSPYKERAAYSTSVEDSVYVHRDHHGTGVGRLLLTELVDRATAHGFHALFARIVAGHAASIGLHTSLGFEVVGNEREVGRKFGTWLDVTVMELILSDR